MNRLLKAFRSVLASFLGVQSDKNLRRDFSDGRFPLYIFAGLFVTVIFLAMVYGLAIFTMAVVR
mgnify:CR=1 FL=1